MKQTGTYYLGRMIKIGILDDKKIFQALANPFTIVQHGNAWTIIDANIYAVGDKQFAYGRLCKFAPETEVAVIDLIKKEKVLQPEKNVILASSPFVYIPEHSGIVFLKVWNHIEPRTFMIRYCSVITETHNGFFVECQIEPVADIRTFATKLSRLDGIYGISATVHPPNPLFGPLWRDLKDYLEQRKADTMKIQEDSPHNEPLNTDLRDHVASIADSHPDPTAPSEPLHIGDAAILMAADGYGSGLVKGRIGSDSVVIRTSETIKNFTFDKDPAPVDLYEAALKIFEQIKHERHMEHDT